MSATSVKPEPITWAYATSQLDLAVLNLGRSVANNVIIKYKSSFFGLGYSTPEETGAPMLIESLAPGASYNFHIHIFTEQSSLDDKYVAKQPINFKLKGVSYIGILRRMTSTTIRSVFQHG